MIARNRVTLFVATVLWMMVLAGLWFYVAWQPFTIQETHREVSVYFNAEHRMLLPNGCVRVEWKVENAKHVVLDGKTVAPEGKISSCLNGQHFNQHNFTVTPAFEGDLLRYSLYISEVFQSKNTRLGIMLSVIALIPYLLAILALKELLPSLRYLPGKSPKALLSLGLAVGLLHGAIVYNYTRSSAVSDWTFWQNIADRLRTGLVDITSLPHMLFPTLTAILDIFFPHWGAIIVSTGAAIFTAWGIYFTLRTAWPTSHSSKRADALSAIFAFMLMFAAPIFVFTPHQLYLGYIPVQVYHNPTIYLLKPFALFLFLASLYALKWASFPALRPAAGAVVFAGVAALTPFAKPSYTIVLVPALGLAVAWKLIRRQSARWQLVASLAVPSLAVLGLQYIINFSGNHADHIQLNPLGFFRVYGRASWWLVPQFFLSVAFPLSVYVAYFKKARHNPGLHFAWVSFFIGAAYAYLFTETLRLQDGNFAWSSQITIFILFVASARFWLVQAAPQLQSGHWRMLSKRFWICLAILLTHFVCGGYWYITEYLRMQLW